MINHNPAYALDYNNRKMVQFLTFAFPVTVLRESFISPPVSSATILSLSAEFHQNRESVENVIRLQVERPNRQSPLFPRIAVLLGRVTRGPS